MKIDEFSQNERKSMSSISGSFWGVAVTRLERKGQKYRTLPPPEGPQETNKTLMIHLSGGFFF